MARQLGIKRCWFHRTHYDIPKRMIDEVNPKCVLISTREIVNIIKENRR